MTGLIGLLVLGSTVLVGLDANRRDWSGDSFADAAWKWVVGMLLLWLVALPVYLVHRRRVPLLGAAAAADMASLEAPERPGSGAPPGMR
jgi:hypothetical protein